MDLFTRFDMMRGIPSRLREFPSNPKRIAIADRIAKIPDSELTRQAVRDAMDGWPDWTKHECDQCLADCEVLVRIGDEPDYDARWLDLCLSCLEKAVELAKSAHVQPSDG